MREWKGKWISVLLCWALLVMTVPVQLVNAATVYAADRQGSITITLGDLGTTREGTSFALYQVGKVEASANLTYILTSAFTGMGVDLNSLQYAAEQKAAAETFMNALPGSAQQEATINVNGTATFTGLEHGVYLIWQMDAASYGMVEPYLVFLPVMNETNDGWVYDIETSPKAEVLSPPVDVVKVDEAGNPLAGASLELYDAEGNLIDSWVTDGTEHRVDAGIQAGKTYTLKEKNAPSGYLLAQDVTFTTAQTQDVTKVTMIDPKGSQEYQVKITKYVMQDGQYRSANFSFYAALFWDEACTQRASDVVELNMNGGYSTTAVIDLLTPGTFYVAETDIDGNVIDTSSPDAFFTNEISNKTITLTPAQATAASTIYNHIGANPPGGFLQEDDAELTIKKKVISGTKEKEVTDTFYFTLFADEEMTTIISTSSLELEKESEGTITFTKLPYGVYYVAETDEDGNLLGADFAYEIVLDENRVVFSSDHKKQAVEIVNKMEEETNPSSTETDTPKPAGGTTTTTHIKKSTVNVKTGDETRAFIYIILLAAAVVVIGGCIYRKRADK